jgi:hypothetical protein
LADEVLGWLEAIGLILFPWQRDVLREGLAMRGRKWAAYEVDLVVPRQNGKNEILAALELAAVAVLGKRLVVHSAHEASTAAKHFARFQELAERLPEVARLLPATKTQGFYTSNGKEHIQFRNGAVIDFKTRSRKAARGFSADLVVLDEAFELPPAAVGSLMYTVRARRNAQVWKTSSAAHLESVVLHADRRRAIADDPDDSRFLYLEWGNERGVDPGSEEAWLRSNPSIGMSAPEFELSLQTFRNELASARHDPRLLAEFVREVCGVPEDSDTASSELPRWAELADASSVAVANHAWALSVSPLELGAQWACFGRAGRRADGRFHVEAMDHRAGTWWVVDRAVEIWKEHRLPLRVRSTGAEGALIGRLVEAGVKVVEVSGLDAAQSCGAFIAAAGFDADGLPLMHHLDDPDLNKAVRHAKRKASTNGSSTWDELGSGQDITPLMSVSVALGGVPSEVRAPRIYSLTPKGR